MSQHDASYIRFRASFIQPDTFGLAKVKEVVFESDVMGPCGRYVGSLRYQVTDAHLFIVQRSYPNSGEDWDDLVLRSYLRMEATRPRWFRKGPPKEIHEQACESYYQNVKARDEWQDSVEIKSFVYKMSDIHGRIEVIK